MIPVFEFRPRPHTDGIIVHDSHSGPAESTVDWLRVQGRSQGLLEVGYHFVLGRDEEVHRTRDHRAMGAHCPGWNHRYIGVCLLAGEHHAPTEGQLDKLLSLVSYLEREYGHALPLKGHSEVQTIRNRRCPCVDMEQLRQRYKEFAVNQPDVKTPPPAEALSPQNQIVLAYLQRRGPLTNLLALTVIGIGSLSKRIAELVALGYPIVKEQGEGFPGNRYVRYSWGGEVVEGSAAWEQAKQALVDQSKRKREAILGEVA